MRNPEVQAVIDEISSELSKNDTDIQRVETKLAWLSEHSVQFDESAKMRLLLAQKKRVYEKA